MDTEIAAWVFSAEKIVLRETLRSSWNFGVVSVPALYLAVETSKGREGSTLLHSQNIFILSSLLLLPPNLSRDRNSWQELLGHTSRQLTNVEPYIPHSGHHLD